MLNMHLNPFGFVGQGNQFVSVVIDDIHKMEIVAILSIHFSRLCTSSTLLNIGVFFSKETHSSVIHDIFAIHNQSGHKLYENILEPSEAIMEAVQWRSNNIVRLRRASIEYITATIIYRYMTCSIMLRLSDPRTIAKKFDDGHQTSRCSQCKDAFLLFTKSRKCKLISVVYLRLSLPRLMIDLKAILMHPNVGLMSLQI